MTGRASALYITLLCLRGGHLRTSTTRQHWPWSSATLQTAGRLTSEPAQLLPPASALCFHMWAHAVDGHAAVSGRCPESTHPAAGRPRLFPWHVCTHMFSPPAPCPLHSLHCQHSPLLLCRRLVIHKPGLVLHRTCMTVRQLRPAVQHAAHWRPRQCFAAPAPPILTPVIQCLCGGSSAACSHDPLHEPAVNLTGEGLRQADCQSSPCWCTAACCPTHPSGSWPRVAAS